MKKKVRASMESLAEPVRSMIRANIKLSYYHNSQNNLQVKIILHKPGGSSM